MKTAKVYVVSYNPEWPLEFEKIKSELDSYLYCTKNSFMCKGSQRMIPYAKLKIEHVGSTAVPGLYAKPIIDIDIVIHNTRSDLPLIINALAEAGYIHEGDLGIDDREAFCYKNKKHLMEHHLYVCSQQSRELKRHTAFRDHLKSSKKDRDEYSQVKLAAAQRYPDDIDAYIKEKSQFIERIYRDLGL